MSEAGRVETQRLAPQQRRAHKLALSKATERLHLRPGAGLQVRVGHVSEAGRVETQRLATHQGRAHKLALQPEAPTCFLSCGEDGAVCCC